MTILRSRFTVALIFVAVHAMAARGDDWPQWMGPARDGVWRERGIVQRIPEGGLPVKWRAEGKGGLLGPGGGRRPRVSHGLRAAGG